MFHVRRRPADSQPRRRKKKPMGVSNGGNNIGGDREGPMLIEITHSGDGGRRVKLGSEPIEVGSANTNALQLFGPSIQARHCLISMHDGVCTVTPLHADGTTFVNGHHIQQPTILHNGSVVMFGRVASYRFVDSPSDGRYNLALSQSQLDSACLYESRSPTSPTSWNEEESRPISPVSSVQQPAVGPKHHPAAGGNSYLDSSNPQSVTDGPFAKPPSFDMQPAGGGAGQQHHHPHVLQHHHHQTQNLLMTAIDGPGAGGHHHPEAIDDGGKGTAGSDPLNDNDIGGGNNIETETKSISSLKSIGSTADRTSTFPKLQPSHAATSITSEPGGQEPILPAVLEFPEQQQEPFLQSVISELDVNSPNFKLAPVYTLYLCARYRASTHYRPDLQPTERAHKLTVFLHHVANLIQNVVQEQYTDAKILSFWMANSSEFLHFLKSDRHISAFSVQAQEVLAESVQTAFRNLVSIFHVELSQTLNQFLSENIDHDSAAGLVLSVLGSAMALLRRCRVNAALTIQLFSQLFHYINVVCFNKFVTTSHMCTSAWGKALSERLSLLELWAEKQGLELAADCHLAKINQCAQFLQAPKTSVTDVQQLACSCFRLNSLQMAALLSQETIPRNLIDTAVLMAESVADELSRADGREIRLEESPDLPLALLLPDDGFSCDVVRGIPAGLVDFLNPFQMAGWCRLASQPTSIGLWTVYMHQFNQGRSPSVMSSKLPQPEVQTIKLHKNANGMGLSIVAAKGAGQERLGIYIKSVVSGGAADLDGRLQAGDQLLEVDGQSLIGITQERAADHLVRTGPVVTLKVAKQGAIYHGLATLLQQPSPVIQRENDIDQELRYHLGRSNESLNLYGGNGRQSRRGSLRRPLTSMMNHTFSTPYLSQHDAYRRMSNPDISQRRYSLSLSHDDILSNDQLQQIHFDPRYRDCRSSNSLNFSNFNQQQRSRSNSLNSIGRNVCQKPVRYDTPPSIYVEDYDTRSNSHSSREMIKIDETAEVETPVDPKPIPIFEIRIEAPSTESNLSFVADVNLDDIPFIDEDDADEEESPGSRSRTTATTPAPCPPAATVPPAVPPPVPIIPPSLSSIMINTASRRGSNASCRKTVSFDIINDREDDGGDAEDSQPPPSSSSFSANRLNNNHPADGTAPWWPKCKQYSNSISVDQCVGSSYESNNNHNDPAAVAAAATVVDRHVGSKPIDAIRDYVVRNFGSTNNNYYCSNNAPSVEAAEDEEEEERCGGGQTAEGSADGGEDDDDHCKLFRKIRLLKEEEATDGRRTSIAKGGRRMSERDMTRIGTTDSSKPPVPSPAGGQQLLNSKSVPALHHVGSIGTSANKSRSIHNLTGGVGGPVGAGGIGGGGPVNSQDQGFYQNLSVYRAQNQSHPNLVERPPIPLQTSLNSPGAASNSPQQLATLQQQQQQQHPILNRPASAYFNSNNNNTNPNNLLLTTPNSMSYTMPNNQQQPSSNLTNISQHQTMVAGGSNTMNNRLPGKQQQPPLGNSFMRDAQSQQSLRMNQMMAPSMPNIAHTAGGYPTGISASQSMQNVNMIAGGGGYNYHSANGSPMLSPQGYPHDQQQQQQLHQHQQQAAQQHASLLRGQAKLAEMNELIKRRQQQQQQQPVSYNNIGNNNGPNKPQQLPPSTAPKPMRSQDDLPPLLPPTATHPLFKPGTGAAYSSSEPPKVGYYPTMPAQSKAHGPLGGNPWEREEKEKETEIRREQIRAWRDQQIAELQSLPQRTQQQEEQLRTLMLERDFERRAMEEDQEYDNDSPYGKDTASVQEVVRLTQASNNNPLTAPLTKLKQVDIKIPPSSQANLDTMSLTSNDTSTNSIPSVSTAIANFQQQQQQQQSGMGSGPSMQPKSILKHNTNSTPSSPSKGTAKTATFVHDNAIARAQLNLSEITANNTNANQMMSQMVHDMNAMNLAPPSAGGGAPAVGNDDRVDNEYLAHPLQSSEQHLMNGYLQDVSNGNLVGGVPPPPPPERNSSYVIMSQQQQKIRSSATKLSFNNNSSNSPASPAMDQPQQQQHQQNFLNNNNSSSNGNGNGAGRYSTTVANNNLLMTATASNSNNMMNNNINNTNNNNNNGASSIAGSSSGGIVGLNSSSAAANMLLASNYKDNKRVSFHDDDSGNNNNGALGGGIIGSSYTQAGHLIGSGDSAGNELGTILERPDPDRFIDETMPAMLHTPTTPEAETWNTQIQATPGVIGAQEVYRDPRTRRLAEQQQKQKAEPVPEKLSFKEKMKMFALESGENNTPKDKLKISRAQRDIDAVH